jgi:hypothetical protein
MLQTLQEMGERAEEIRVALTPSPNATFTARESLVDRRADRPPNRRFVERVVEA